MYMVVHIHIPGEEINHTVEVVHIEISPSFPLNFRLFCICEILTAVPS